MLKNNFKKLGITFALIFGLFPSTAHLASIEVAAPAPYQNLNFKQAPGTKIQVGLDLKNSGTTKVSFDLYTSDAIQTETGGFAAKSKNAKNQDVGLWSSVSDPHLKIAAQKTASTKLTIDIPKYAAPGQYKGALVIEEDTTVANSTPSRTAIPINIEVTGIMINHLDVSTPTSSKSADGVSFHTTLSNTGNTSLKVYAELHISEFGFLNNIIADKTDLSLFKGQKADIILNWNKNPFLGFFKATIEIKYYQDLPFEKNLKLIDTYQYSLPVSFCNIFLTIIFGLILLITGVLFYNRSKHAHKKN